MNKTIVFDNRVVVVPDQQQAIPMFVVAPQSGVDHSSDCLHDIHCNDDCRFIIATFHGEGGGLIKATRLFERQLLLASGEKRMGYFERYDASYVSVNTDAFTTTLQKVHVDAESVSDTLITKKTTGTIEMWQVVVDADNEVLHE